MRAQRASLLVAAVVICQSWLAASSAAAQTGGLPDLGHQWSVVTGINAPIVTPPSANFPFGRAIQSVNYDYRIMTREVTNTEWLQFVRAFAPHLSTVGVGATDPQFRGTGIEWLGSVGGVPQYQLSSEYANRPTDPGWRFVARFCNWLHNGKPLPSQSPGGVVPLSVFESGAYDTSTFLRVIDPVSKTPIYLDQPTRSENAQFWIPDSHEWVKAMFWDPNKNGPGVAGYWQYPITSDTAPISGDPAFGGQTNAGPFPQGQTRPLDVGSYPDVMSPWGLLDGSGGASEWLEDWKNPATPQLRLRGGTASISLFNPATVDRIGGFQQGSPVFAGGGIRLASLVIPAPGVCVTLGALCLGWGGRRRSLRQPSAPPT
ncbi:MAG: SUMF1/EgtB/PvdO family nonheme iron enzyme [Phycisphaerales bacterium]